MRLTRTTNQLQRTAPAASCRLEIADGPDAPCSLDLPPAGVVVGSSHRADVVLSDDAVSRRHCSIVPTESGFRITDLGSRNGTRVEGARVREAELPPGATLLVGRSLLRLLPADELLAVEPSERRGFGELCGASIAMRRVYTLLERAAASDAPVLLAGESGTGKELAARALHDQGRRRAAPFVVFDCGAATETLVASDLFGHRRGAFTGADGDRPGAFARAHGGTLFLDEIGDLPMELQPKLLRLLERGEVLPLGAREPVACDVRVVAATHRDLWELVRAGAFRADLYYRLAILDIELPPLRARKEDIAALVERFLGAPVSPASAALERLRRHDWPGNVRELRNVVVRARALGPPGTPFEELPLLLGRRAPEASTDAAPSLAVPFAKAKEDLVADFERRYLRALLEAEGDNLARAARRAGIERKHLYRLLARHGMARPGAALTRASRERRA